MRGSLVVVTGTGTEVGKTHASVALLLRARRTLTVCGFKPVESGVDGGEGSDGQHLREAGTFHVKHPRSPYLLRRPVSPHLAAREAGVTIELGPILTAVEALRSDRDHVLVELAGGLFSPLAPGLLMVDLVAALAPTRIVLVAPDRLGVLHDVGATVRAAGTLVSQIGVVLSAPSQPDASTGTNGAELGLVTSAPLICSLRRAPTLVLADQPELSLLVSWAFAGAAH